jgi:hypothetical protein
MVVELFVLEWGTWWSFMADRIPEALDDAIKGKKLAFMEAFKQLTPAEIKAEMPVMFPSTHIFDVTCLPGVARFPVDEWEKSGEPCLTQAGWAAMAMKVASKDMRNLQAIFDVGANIVEKHPLELEALEDMNRDTKRLRSEGASSSEDMNRDTKRLRSEGASSSAGPALPPVAEANDSQFANDSQVIE